MTAAPLELAPDIARIRALYKLLPITAPMHVLEIVASDETPVVFHKQDSSDIQLISARVEKLGYRDVNYNGMQVHPLEHLFEIPGHTNTYDLIVMHGTFSNLKNSLVLAGNKTSNNEIFKALNTLLSSTGIIAGCIENRLSSSGLMSPATSRANAHCLSYGGLKRALRDTGFNQPRIFSLYPGRYSPINLAEVNGAPSMEYSKSQVGYLKNWLGKPNYWLKQVLSLFGISLWFEHEYFFYAIKP